VKLLKLIFLCGFVFLSTGLSFVDSRPQTDAKTASTEGTKTKDAAAQTKSANDEVIPPAAPNSIFPAVVARVNGQPILGRDLEELIRQELTSIGNPEWKNLREEYRSQLINNHLTSLISTKLLYQQASANGITVTETEVQDELQKMAKNYSSDAEFNAALASQNIDRTTLEKNLFETLAMSKFVNETINKKVEVSQEELAKFYSANPAQFNHPEIVRTSHILIRPAGNTAEQDAIAKERAEALLARIKKGEDFAKLAKENSVDVSASKGGDLGFAAKEALEPEYAEAAFSLPVGGVKLVKTQYGYHIIKVTDKKKEGLAALEEVKPDLTEFLKNQKAQAELNKLLKELREKAKIEILIQSGQPENG
jgi:peptidyl-prolyl cis-trans isomerase C